RLGEQVSRLNPDQVGFQVNSEAMLARASSDDTFWSGFWDYLWRRPAEPMSVELQADHSEELLQSWVADVALRYDRPSSSASARLDTLSFSSGESGYVLDQEAALSDIQNVLYQPVNRTVEFYTEE